MKKQAKKSASQIRKLLEKQKPPISFLHNGHPLTNDWSGTTMAFELLERFIDDHHKVLALYPGFNESFPKWQEERGQVAAIKRRVLKLVWDHARKNGGKAVQKDS